MMKDKITKKTLLAEELEALADKARYDNCIRNLLANKMILAWIMRFCIEEFADMDVKDIISCIENDADIASKRVEPGLSNTKIIGDTNENIIPGEGKITYDLIFHAKTQQDQIEVIINIEAQNDTYPGYDLESRGIFYCSRMLSAQAGREFSLAKQEYDRIRKVYSIWILADPPEKQAYTISAYKMNHQAVYGNGQLKTGRYDLLQLVIIRLGKDHKKGNELLKMLNTLLSSEIPVCEKERILNDDFRIEMSAEMIREAEKMCNLSDGVERRGMIKGEIRGAEKTRFEIASAMVTEGLSDSLISKTTKLSLETVAELRKQRNGSQSD